MSLMDHSYWSNSHERFSQYKEKEKQKNSAINKSHIFDYLETMCKNGQKLKVILDNEMPFVETVCRLWMHWKLDYHYFSHS